MEQINLNEVLFHGVTHYMTEHRQDKAMQRLNSILKCRAILSRNLQEKTLHTLNLPQNKFKKVMWNGMDYISVCEKEGPLAKIGCVTDESEAFSDFVKNGTSIILSRSILTDLQTRNGHLQEGEFQIKDQIPAKYFLGIAIYNISDEQLIEWTSDYLQRGLVDKTTCREFLVKRYLHLEPLKQCLKSNGFEHLQLYSINDGKIITNAENVYGKIFKNNEKTLEK